MVIDCAEAVERQKTNAITETAPRTRLDGVIWAGSSQDKDNYDFAAS
jgi:hypothetical protein